MQIHLSFLNEEAEVGPQVATAGAAAAGELVLAKKPEELHSEEPASVERPFEELADLALFDERGAVVTSLPSPIELTSGSTPKCPRRL